MHEHVLVAGGRLDEPIAFGRVEPFDGTLRHRLSPGLSVNEDAERVAASGATTWLLGGPNDHVATSAAGAKEPKSDCASKCIRKIRLKQDSLIIEASRADIGPRFGSTHAEIVRSWNSSACIDLAALLIRIGNVAIVQSFRARDRMTGTFKRSRCGRTQTLLSWNAAPPKGATASAPVSVLMP